MDETFCKYVLAAGATHALWKDATSPVQRLPHRQALKKLRNGCVPLLCHKRLVFGRMGVSYKRQRSLECYDVLELASFVDPRCNCAPRAKTLCDYFGLRPGVSDSSQNSAESEAQELALLPELAETLLILLQKFDEKQRRQFVSLAEWMQQGKWNWAPIICSRLRGAHNAQSQPRAAPASPIEILSETLPQWEYAPSPHQGEIKPIEGEEARNALLGVLRERNAEPRPEQAEYCGAITHIFDRNAQLPSFLFAEAGTGIGKTLGYLVPAELWAQRNLSPVWIATYTRNLQHQILGEQSLNTRIVVRKGRENYLCLRNLAEASGSLALENSRIVLGLMARWAQQTSDGDLNGADFPNWLTELFGGLYTTELRDRPGECTNTACAWYRQCFFEHKKQQVERADIIVTNHAFLFETIARQHKRETNRETNGKRCRTVIFDEGHHIFESADRALACALGGRDMETLHNWLHKRGAGLHRLVAEALRIGPAGEQFEQRVSECLGNNDILAHTDWLKRVQSGKPETIGENFLACIYTLIDEKSQKSKWSRELAITEQKSQKSRQNASHWDSPHWNALRQRAGDFLDALKNLERSLETIAGWLHEQTLEADSSQEENHAARLSASEKMRLRAFADTIRGHALNLLKEWRAMLEALVGEESSEMVPAMATAMVFDWLEITQRPDEKPQNIGMHRHFTDPAKDMVEKLFDNMKGVAVTSASLFGGNSGKPSGVAGARLGVPHISGEPHFFQQDSPFDYKKNSRIFVASDIGRKPENIALAVQELFLSVGGGGLAIFTAIERLKGVYQKIAPPLAKKGITLYAQHVDHVSTHSLIDMFRTEPSSCLLGTDAVRDGIDVPGDSLRLVIFERVPWPRQSLLEKARQRHFGADAWTDFHVHMKLRQAYGRLVRKADDKGIFVILEPCPFRFYNAFPEGVAIKQEPTSAIAQFAKAFFDK